MNNNAATLSIRIFPFLILGLLLQGQAFPGVPTPELARQVEIRRTEYGVPHIKGESLKAVAFGLAYCQAEDHAVTIMEHILRARGELAQHFPGRSNIESDFRNRQFRVRARAIETYHKLDPDFRSMLEGYAQGFSYYINLHRDTLPLWVTPINGHDVASHGMTGVMRFAFNRGNIIRNFKRRMENTNTALLESDPEEVMGSNMWAFAPNRTKSGNTILMGNPHQPWSKVATYYEAHLTVPGELNFYGSTFIGRPVLTTGFNDNLGWSHTVNYPDLEEIYELDVDPNNPDHYLFDGGSVPLTKNVVTVPFMSDKGMAEETRTFWYSPLGPVIHRTENKVYVLKSVAYEEFRFYQQWLRFAQSQNFQQFKEALKIAAIPMFNICYADREGNIYYLWNGTIPDIPLSNKRDEAVHATQSSDIWKRVHDIDELPQLLNPRGGYVHNSNSAPYLTNLFEPMDRNDYPSHFPDNRFSLRSQLSALLIHNGRKFSLEDVRDMKFNLRMTLAERVKADLIDAVRETGARGEVARALALVKKWNNTVAADTRGSVLFKVWWRLYEKDNDHPFEFEWTEEEPVTSPRGLGDKDRAVETFIAAIKETTDRYGSWAVAWGDVHRVRRGDVDLPASGGGGRPFGCFRVMSFKEDDDGKLVVNGGDSWIFTVEFGDTPKAYTVVGYSQSGNPDSPHYNDQTILYANNQMKRAAFTEEEIQDQLLKAYRPGKEQ